MNRVFKYQFEITDKVTIQMSKGAKVISVQMQKEVPTMWAVVDDTQPMEPVKFRIFGTGHNIENIESLEFVGTIQVFGGNLVFHVFKEMS